MSTSSPPPPSLQQAEQLSISPLTAAESNSTAVESKVGVESKGPKKGKRAAGKARGEEGREVGISKALSKILRHDALKEGLSLDGEGFGSVEWLLQYRRLKSLQCTFTDIKYATLNNSKQRFTLRSDPTQPPLALTTSTDPSKWFIRANQGHSLTTIDAEALLTPITEEAGNVPETVIHGTYYGVYESIMQSKGLSPMGRNHIHFSTGLPKAVIERGHFNDEPEASDENDDVHPIEPSDDEKEVISGMRADAEVLFYINIRTSLAAGTKWYLSSNGVVLTPGNQEGVITSEFWEKVVGRRQDVGVLWEGGKRVGELPANVKGRRAPSGKGPRGKLRGRGGRSGGGRNRELEVLGGEV